MRKKKNLSARLAAVSKLIVAAPSERAGFWRSTGAARPYAALRVELGCGMGRFASQCAARHPDIMFVAVERVPEALVVAAEKAKSAGLDNLLFIAQDAALLETWFASGEVDRLYIHFCDPWRKKKQAKRRLTHRDFLRRYRHILSGTGELWFKSDDRPLVEFTLQELSACSWEPVSFSDDWHNDLTRPPDDIMTEYEAKFSERSIPIGRITARSGVTEE